MCLSGNILYRMEWQFNLQQSTSIDVLLLMRSCRLLENWIRKCVNRLCIIDIHECVVLICCGIDSFQVPNNRRPSCCLVSTLLSLTPVVFVFRKVDNIHLNYDIDFS